MSFKTKLKTQLIEELKAHVLMTNKLQTVVNATVDRVFKEELGELRKSYMKHQTAEVLFEELLKE